MQDKKFDAVIFDLDGVITKTALAHSAAWKKMFDAFLLAHANQTKTEFKAFTHKEDYLPFVDGKPRYKGVADFLDARGIVLPFGNPSDAEDVLTICGLGNRKNSAFNEVLEREGVEVFPSTVALIHQLRAEGYRVGVASSSKNCEAVLEAAGLTSLVETRVDGVVSAEMGLHGKPEADIFITAAKNLACDYERCVIVEDAVSGVQAGRNGNFGLVIGLAREENSEELYVNGADIVVADLDEITIESINQWFEHGLENDLWSISYHDYNQQKERSREALLAIGNGYFGTRGTMEEMNANPVNYPGTYMAGLYNRLTTNVAGRDVENEDFVNIPNWLPVSFRINKGEWFDVNGTRIIKINRTLNFKNGLLTKLLIVEDVFGQQTEIISERFASMSEMMLASLRYSIRPINYSGQIEIKSIINGAVKNEGVERYKSLNSKHFNILDLGAENDVMHVLVETNQSKVQIAIAAKHAIIIDGLAPEQPFTYEAHTGSVCATVMLDAVQGRQITLEKNVAICSDKESFIDNALESAQNAVSKTQTFENILIESAAKWYELWQEIDVCVTGDRMSQKLLRMHLFHLMVSVSPFNALLDASITARGLHGEAYRGHIFWDELFILPIYDLHLPAVASSMLQYRYRRLTKAIEYAHQHGYKGAMYPWQSGSDGREETQVVHLNPLTGKWGDDHSALQRHVSLAIAYNIWDYFWITEDRDFLKKYGSEVFFQICRFWASKSIHNSETDRYEISGVMGPDEFHEHLPGNEAGGLKDNTYTNIMVAWMFEKANEISKIIGNEALQQKGFSLTELEQWNEIASKLNLVINEDGILAQYDGYFDLNELDWDAYRKKYGSIYRMDRILKAEGKSPDAYKVAKQADTLMAFYNLNKSEVDAIIKKLGYQLPNDYLQRNLNYYLARTSHGSTLSRVVHARLAAMVNNPQLSWELYKDALGSDYIDIQGGTTGEGIHAGVMAGTVLIALNTFAGVNYRNPMLHISPNLPNHWKSIAFKLQFKGVRYSLRIDAQKCQILADKQATIVVKGKEITCNANEMVEVYLF